jgi:DsbC/DsbD-like thiol-disulfide interchange protein
MRAAALAALLLIPAGPVLAAGEGASAWSRMHGAALRLVDGGPSEGGRRLAGIDIRLPPGFKTYWRTPGDSGVPPVIDFSGSENVAAADVLFPAPARFEDGAGGHSWGYRQDVTFPVLLAPLDPARAIRLVAKVDYAICSNICIPVQGEAELALPAGPAPDAAIAADLARHHAAVPARQALGAAGPLSLAAIRPGGAPGTLALEIVAPSTDGLAVFIESPAGWVVDAGAPVSRADGRLTVPATVAERPKDGGARVDLTVTVVSSRGAIEVVAVAQAP